LDIFKILEFFEKLFGNFLEFFGDFFDFFLKFLGIFLEIFREDFFGGIFWRNFLREIFWEEFFVCIGIDLFVKILVFVKILSQGRRRKENFNL
jgi:hypothetical protein